VVVTVNNAAWVVNGEMLYVDTAGGGPGQAGILQVTNINGNQLTLLNPQPPPAIPLANQTTDGLLAKLSSFGTDYVGGDNACHPLIPALLGFLVPTGSVFDFAGATAPTGFLLCQGQAISRTTYSGLYAALGGSSSPWGQGDGSTTFNVPDLRGAASIGAGQGTGLTSRALGAIGGEESHLLTVAELAVHTHGASQGTHTHTDSGHAHYCSGVDHLHSLQGHTHGMDHYHAIGAGQFSHAHTVSARGQGTNQIAGSTSPAFNIGIQSVAGDAATLPAGNTVYASQTNGAWVNTGGPSTGTTAASDRSLAFNSNAASAVISTNSAGAITIADAGSGTAHNNMMPFAVMNKIIKI
jgi:microcystin-dependent protein